MAIFTTPITATAGAIHAAEDWNEGVRDNWIHATEIQDWSPSISQVTSGIARTLNYGRWWRTGKRVHAVFHALISGTGTSGTQITASLPVNAAAAVPLNCVLGEGYVYDATDAAVREGAVVLASASTVAIRVHLSTNNVGNNPALGLASGDIISMSLDYESV